MRFGTLYLYPMRFGENEMDKVLNVVESRFEALSDYVDHCSSLEDYLASNKDAGWDYQRFDDRFEIMITYNHTTELTYIRYCGVNQLTDEMIENSTEFHYTGEINKEMLKEIYYEQSKGAF